MRVEFERLLRIGLVVLWMLVSWLASSPILRAQPVSLPQPELITDRQGLPQAFVPSILQDRQGFIWAATRDGLCRYDGRQFKVFQPDPDGRPSLSFAGLEQLVLDHQAYIWIVSERGDLDRFNPRTETFTNFSRQPAFRRMLTGNTSFRLCIDRQDRLWIMPKGNGVLCYNLKTNQGKWFRHQAAQTGSLSSDTVNDVAEGPDGVIWLATTNGLDRLDKPTQQFTHFQNQPTSLQSLPDNHIDGLHIRPTGEIMMLSRQHLSLLQPHTGKIRSYLLPDQGNQWQDTHFAADRKGTIYFDQNSILFRFTDQQGPTVAARWNQPTDDCASLFIDQTDVLWVGTNGAGIRTYDLRPNPFHTRRYTHQFHVDLLTSGVLGLAPIPPVAVSALKGLISYNFRSTFDTGDRLWFNVGSSDVYQLDPKTGKTDHYPLPVVFRSKLVSDTPCPMVTDPQGRVWAVYDSMAFWYDKQKGSWVRSEYSIPYEPASAITALVIDSQALWLASRAGGLWRVDRRTGRAKQFANHPDNPNSISSNSLYCLSADPTDSNHLWIGTFGNGLCLFDKRTEQFRRFNQSNGLPNNVVYSALPDRQGYLWIGTNKGLCRMNRRTFTTQIFTRDDGILADEFNSHHFLQFPDGTILMGGLEGFTVFDPRQIVGDRFEPPIELTGLQINNQVVVPDRPAAKGADTDRRSDERISPLGDLPTQATQQITLLYDQNYVTAQFAALQFNRPAKNRFRYRLEELETTWKQTDRPEAVYTNLPPGQYTLVLNATNTSGVWSRYVRRLGITIQPPIWATWWAYIVYVLAIAAAAFFLIRSSLNRLRLQQTVVLQEQKVEQLRLIDEMKARFLTNITHEFRTPLTLILTPAQRLSPTLHQPDQHRWLAAIERNAYQLLRLINQLMELAKLDAQALKVEESRGHLSTFIEELVQPFEESASAKGIQLIYQSDVLGDYWFDADKLEPIVTNLIANAIKFTPGRTGQNRPDATLEEGQINVSLRSQDGVILTVSDTGIGISAEELPYIFDRFYQAGQGSPSLRSSDESTTLILPNADPYKQGGTGIGLALVKELIQLQGGTIDVTSQPGHGTVFYGSNTLPPSHRVNSYSRIKTTYRQYRTSIRRSTNY